MTIIKKIGLLFAVGAFVGGAFWVRAAETSTDSVTAPAATPTPAPATAPAPAAAPGQRMKLRDVREQAQQKVAAERESFQKKVQQIKDEKKKEAASALYERLQDINTTWTDHFADMLDKYATLLERVSSRKGSLTDPADAARVDSAIQAGNNAVTAARQALEVQAKKIYAVSVSTDSKLRSAFKTAHAALKKDLFALRDGAMRDAREAVQKAIQALRPAAPQNASSSQ